MVFSNIISHHTLLYYILCFIIIARVCKDLMLLLILGQNCTFFRNIFFYNTIYRINNRRKELRIIFFE